MSEYNGTHRHGSAEGRPAHSRRTSRLLLVAGLLCIAAALVIAGSLIWRYLSANNSYQQIEDVAGIVAMSDTEAPDDLDPNDLKINWDALHEINPEIVAWVVIPGTRINYPVVQTSDNDYYLSHLFDRSYSSVGAIFLDHENSSSLTDRNNMIYGHNMMDGSMFAGLQAFQGQGYFEEHRKVLLATPERVYVLQTVAVVVCEGTDKLRKLRFTDDASFKAYLDELMRYAVVSDAQAVAGTSQLFCFATCTDLGNSKRTILLATPATTEGALGGDKAPAQ